MPSSKYKRRGNRDSGSLSRSEASVTTINTMDIEGLQEETVETDNSPHLRFIPVESEMVYMSPDGVTYELMQNHNLSGNPKLFTSTGYSYGLDGRSKSSKIKQCWRCTKRPPQQVCNSRIMQFKDGTFVENDTEHNHPPDPHEYIHTKIRMSVKSMAIKYKSVSTMLIAKKVIDKYLPHGLDGHDTLSLQNLATVGNRYRRNESAKNGGDGVAQKRNKHFLGVWNEKQKDNQKRRKKAKKRMQDSEDEYSSVGENEMPSTSKREGYTSIYVPTKFFKQMIKDGVGNAVNSQSDSSLANDASSTQILPSGSRPSLSDPDEMFFLSLASEVKDIPKVLKSAIKLEILSLVNSALQNVRATENVEATEQQPDT